MIEGEEAAKAAGLSYMSDNIPGIRRIRRGRGFSYKDERTGKIIQKKEILARIKDLVIPPAWDKVWISHDPEGHLQVTGIDKKGRKQYRYHPEWCELRNSHKFDQLIDLGESLAKLRERMESDLKLTGLPRNKVLAAVIKLMLLTQCRIGNSVYAEENDSYGLTTLLNEHAEVHGQKIEIHFKGKSGVDHDLALSDRKLAQIILRCQDLPGEELFCYLGEEGEAVDVNSTHINEYLREITGKDFTAKDLRTWGGTCKALELIMGLGSATDLKETQWKRRHLDVIKKTASYLRNTVSVCRKYYVHPLVLEADRGGVLPLLWASSRASKYLDRYEKLLLNLLAESQKIRARLAS
jgi:DNA topoisomerase I